MAKAKKFGTFGGVFTPSILTILGVIMYLRLPWIVGQAGLLSTLAIIVVAHIISASTGLSVASIATDKKVEGGGTYYIISRSLGLPIGGTLGWALFIGLSFSVSLYLIGFAEVFLSYFGFEVTLNNIRIAGVLILLFVTILTFISTSLAIKTQYLVLTAMVLSLVSVFMGNHTFSPVALQTDTLPDSLPWIALFAIFFPAVTGFEAGVSMSGDLKDPKRAIPRGTIAAILVGLVTYVGLAWYFAATVDRKVLVNDPNVLFSISWLPQLVIAGILGATFSSALGSILSAPRILQAVAKDRIAPRFFSKGYGPSNEPRNAILLTFVIALGGILIGELNVIARIVTTFFIITYGFLNITYTVESWASSDFRPSFRIPRFVSIIGAIASIVVMIQLDIMAMIGASAILLLLFLVLRRQELNLQSGDTWTSVWMSIVKYGLKKLTRNELHTRNWRPNVILLSGGVGARPHLVEMGQALIGHQGVFTNFELQEDADPASSATDRVRLEKLKDFPDVLTRKYRCTSVYEGIDMVSRVYGFSGFEPDTILMGWPKATANPVEMNRLLHTLQKRNFILALLDYDTVNGFGDYSTIDFWWTGSGRELTLALHLMRFISTRKEWRKAKFRILVLNEDATLTERYYSLLKQLVDEYRISAEVKVVMNLEKRPAADRIVAESKATGLTLLTLPAIDESTSEHFIEQGDLLSSQLHSCLWISASDRFEMVDVLPDTITRISETDVRFVEDKVSSALDVSMAERDARELIEFAQQADTNLSILERELFEVVEHRRKAVVDALIVHRGVPEKWVHLIDYQIKDELLFEKELLHRCIGTFVDSIKTNVDSLLKQLVLKPGRKDVRSMEIAVRYYLYARRIDSVEHFYTEFLLRSVHFNVSLRELLVLSSTDGLVEDTTDGIGQIQDQTKTHLRELYIRIVTDLRQDLLLLSQLLEGPKLNEMYAGLKKLIHQKEAKAVEMEEIPARLSRFMQLQWNRTKLDGIGLLGKDKARKVNRQLVASVHQLVEGSLYASLNSLLVQLTNPENKEPISLFPTDVPVLEHLLVKHNESLKQLIEEVPEVVTVTGNSLVEHFSVSTIDTIEELEVNVRALVDYYCTNELVDQVNRQAQVLLKGIQRVAVATGNIAKLTAYHLSQQSPGVVADSKLISDLKANVEREIVRLQTLETTFAEQIDEGLNKAFESLSAAEIVNSITNVGSRIVPRHQQRRMQLKLFRVLADYRRRMVQAFVMLFYHQSKGVLWTKRQELIRERSALYPGDVLKRYSESHSPDPAVLAQLPYYYVNLFTDDAGASREFRVVMQEETERGHEAIRKFKDGLTGIVVITGDKGSGKSSLARYLVEHHFDRKSIWKIRPPLECSADRADFDTQLKELAGGKGSLERRLDMLSGKRVVLVDDLEVWWERRAQGAQVVERMLELVRLYGSQLLFVVTINRHALRVLEQLTQLNSWINELIYCQPFDAKELKEMILTRHQAGGMSFVLDEKEEDDFSNWSYARYFNHLFNCTGGNPGEAAHRWLCGIRSVEGTRITIEKPVFDELDAVGHLSDQEWLVILQLVMHRRCSVAGLAKLVSLSPEIAAASVRQLVRVGVLREVGSGIYSLQPALEPALISNLKKMSFL